MHEHKVGDCVSAKNRFPAVREDGCEYRHAPESVYVEADSIGQVVQIFGNTYLCRFEVNSP